MNNSMVMMEEVRKPGVPSMLETQLGSIAEGIQQLADVCKSQQDMVQYLLGLSSGSHLENRTKVARLDSQNRAVASREATCFADGKATSTVQNDSLPEVSERSFDIMAKEHRIRVVVGHDEEGNEIIKRLSATDELKLADKVIEAVVKSGRIKDFIDQEIEYGPHEKQVQEEAAQPPVVKTKFSDYIVQWRRIFKTGKAATYEVFMDAKQSVLLKWFGDKYIEDITPTDVQDFLSHRAKTYKKATVKADWAMLKEVLDSAVSDDLIVKNPAKDKRVHNPAKAGEGTAPLTREQIASIQKAIPELEDSRERCLIALLAYTSMRREEVLGLMWENINFETRMIEIKQAVVHPVNVAVTKETKNEFSVRPFPMCDQLYNILLGSRKERGYVISKEDGSPVSQVTYRRLWDSLKSHIELYGMTAINFRTTFATMMVASGVDIKTTQALMGHSTPEMTLKVYAKKEESRLPDAVRKMESFLAGSAAF